MLTGRRDHSASALLVLASLAFASTARADTAIPFVAESSKGAVLLFVLIVPLEAFVLLRVVHVSLKRAFLESLVANTVTTVLGVGLGCSSVFLNSAAFGVPGFVLLFAISIVVEGHIIKARLRLDPKPVYVASAIMNTLSYGLLAIAALIFLDVDAAARKRRHDAAIMQAASAQSGTPSPVHVGGGGGR